MLPAECGQAWEYKTCGIMVIERPTFYGLDSQEFPRFLTMNIKDPLTFLAQEGK